MGAGGVVSIWCLQSVRDLLRGVLESRWPEHFGDKPQACLACGYVEGDESTRPAIGYPGSHAVPEPTAPLPRPFVVPRDRTNP